MLAMAIIATPKIRKDGSGRAKNARPVKSASNTVLTPKKRERERGASERCPINGAVRAMKKPAMAMPALSTADVCSGEPKDELVRYTVNTKVSMIAWNAEDPVSHKHQARTCARVPTVSRA